MPDKTFKESKNGIDFFTVKYNRAWTFRNVQKTSFYSEQKGFSSWIAQYKKFVGPADRCFSCNVTGKRLVGGHMKRKDKMMDINNHFIIPICDSCNNYRNDKKTEVNIPANTLLLKAKPTLKKRLRKAINRSSS